MKIKCKERYEKTVKYAESIGDETLKKCIERLKQWEKNYHGKPDQSYAVIMEPFHGWSIHT